MTLFDRIATFLKKETSTGAPEGFCPNCWGRQEYGGHFFAAIKKENIDANQLNEKKGWIVDYAEKHLTGIQLQEEDAICPKCKLSYRAE